MAITNVYGLIPEGEENTGAGDLYSKSTIEWTIAENAGELADLSGETRTKFVELFHKAWRNNMLLYFSDGQRSFYDQDQRYKRYMADPIMEPAEAPAGFSYHNYGRALKADMLNYNGVGFNMNHVDEIGALALESGLSWKLGSGTDNSVFVNQDKPIEVLQDLSLSYKTWAKDHPPTMDDVNNAEMVNDMIVSADQFNNTDSETDPDQGDTELVPPQDSGKNNIILWISAGSVLLLVGVLVSIKLIGSKAK